MTDPERLGRRTRALLLLDEAFRAHQAGDMDTNTAKMNEALAVDAEAVALIVAGFRTGDVPNPDVHPKAWARYVAMLRDGT